MMQVDEYREISVRFREARDAMVWVYEAYGEDSQDFADAFAAYEVALEAYGQMMSEYESIRDSIRSL